MARQYQAAVAAAATTSATVDIARQAVSAPVLSEPGTRLLVSEELFLTRWSKLTDWLCSAELGAGAALSAAPCEAPQ